MNACPSVVVQSKTEEGYGESGDCFIQSDGGET